MIYSNNGLDLITICKAAIVIAYVIYMKACIINMSLEAIFIVISCFIIESKEKSEWDFISLLKIFN